MDSFSFSPIGIISSCYKEKFGIPRQPGLVKAAKAKLVLGSNFKEECVRGLEGFSHLWINFVFHATQQQGWKPMVRPPRLGGNAKVGVFASRSPFRPNPLGLSLVELIDIEIRQSAVVLHLAGCDLMDGTPVLDIKPYLPYSDSIPGARGGFAENPPENRVTVNFSKEAKLQCKQASGRLGEDVELFVCQVLGLDPRPSYQKIDSSRVYSMKLYDFDLKWQYCENNEVRVIGLLPQ